MYPGYNSMDYPGHYPDSTNNFGSNMNNFQLWNSDKSQQQFFNNNLVSNSPAVPNWPCENHENQGFNDYSRGNASNFQLWDCNSVPNHLANTNMTDINSGAQTWEPQGNAAMLFNNNAMHDDSNIQTWNCDNNQNQFFNDYGSSNAFNFQNWNCDRNPNQFPNYNPGSVNSGVQAWETEKNPNVFFNNSPSGNFNNAQYWECNKIPDPSASIDPRDNSSNFQNWNCDSNPNPNQYPSNSGRNNLKNFQNWSYDGNPNQFPSTSSGQNNSANFQYWNSDGSQNQCFTPGFDNNSSGSYNRTPQKYSAQARLYSKRKRPDFGAGPSNFPEHMNEGQESKGRKDYYDDVERIDSDVYRSYQNQNFKRKNQRRVKDLVMKRIREDRKFQDKLKNLVIIEENMKASMKCEDKGESMPTDANDNTDAVQNFQNEGKRLVDVNAAGNENESQIVDEEMDWEPSEQEVMIEHINSMRKSWDTTNTFSSELAVHTDKGLAGDSNKLIIVIDTNIFISCLPFVKEMLDTQISDLGYPIVYIPWRVLRELDHLKTSTRIHIEVSAIKAIRFLSDSFSAKHPRLDGQSFDNYCQTRSSDCVSPDDEILKICINLNITENQRRVILITNDRNLVSKAIVSSVEAYSKQNFVKDILNKHKTCTDSNAENQNSGQSESYNKLQFIMKTILEKIAETEIKNAFGDEWERIVTRKPPWDMPDVFECFVKHWRSVFTFVFENDLFPLILDLKEIIQRDDTLAEKDLFSDFAQASLKLLRSVRGQIGTKESPYRGYLNRSIREIETLIGSDKQNDEEEASSSQLSDPSPSTSALPQEAQDYFDVTSSMFDQQQCRERVKSLFQVIWDQINIFCCRIGDLVSTTEHRSQDAIEEIKYQFPHVMQKLQELIENVEKIVSLDPEEIIQSDQLIMNFTNFLVSLNVFEIEVSEMTNLPKYIGFFCCDSDCRALLGILINDLRQFAAQVMDGVKFLGFL